MRKNIDDLSIKEIVTLIRTNNPTFLEQLANFIQGKIIPKLSYKVENKADLAWDTVEALMKLCERNPSPAINNFCAYTTKICKNKCSKDYKRKERYYLPQLVHAQDIDKFIELNAPVVYEEETLHYKELIRKVQEEIDIFKKKCELCLKTDRNKYCIITLSTYENLSHKEIGELLNITENNSRKRLCTCRKRLTERIQNNYPDDEFKEFMK